MEITAIYEKVINELETQAKELHSKADYWYSLKDFRGEHSFSKECKADGWENPTKMLNKVDSLRKEIEFVKKLLNNHKEIALIKSLIKGDQP